MAELAIQYARQFIGTPYVWGGNNPLRGWDCGGFVCEVLRSCGILREREDLNSQMLYDRFRERAKPRALVEAGDLLFYGQNASRITHVSLAVSPSRIIESAGGGPKTDSITMAAVHGAFVRERPISFRQDIVAVCSVPWPNENL